MMSVGMHGKKCGTVDSGIAITVVARVKRLNYFGFPEDRLGCAQYRNAEIHAKVNNSTKTYTGM